MQFLHFRALGVQVMLLFGPDSKIKHALNKKAPQNKRKKKKRRHVLGNLKRGVVITLTLSLPDTAFTHTPDTSFHTPESACVSVHVCVCTRPPLHVLRVIIKAQQTSRTSPAALLQKYTRLSHLPPHSAREECRKHATR